MPPAIPLVAAAAGAAAAGAFATTAVGFAVTTSLFGTGLFASIGGAMAFSGALAGFVVSTAVDAIGTRALTKKPKASSAASSSFGQDVKAQATMVQSSVESHKIIYGQAKVSGPIIYIGTTDSGPDATGEAHSGSNQFLHIVIAVAGHEIDSFGDTYFGDAVVPLNAEGWSIAPPYNTQTAGGLVRVKKYLGSPDQEACPELVAEVPGWDGSHRLRGVAYLYVRLEFDREVFSQGIPNISAVVRGKKVYDPRSATTAWSMNAALCTRDYLASDYGFNCPGDEINDAYWIAAANVCEESVALSNGDLRARYTCNGVLDTASMPLDNLTELVASMAGAVTYVQGRFRGYAGSYDAPAGDLDPSMLAGAVKVRTRTARQDLFNTVQGTYINPQLGWQATDFPPVTNGDYIAQDGGQQLFKDIVLGLTNDHEAAQRIATVILEQGRQGIQLELPLNHRALAFAVWDTVTYTDPTFGWDHKVFRIKKLSTAGLGAITLSLQEESSASYDWNGGMATVVDTAPDTNLPDPFTVQPPRALEVSEAAYVTREGDGVKSSATMAWLASTDAFLAQYQPEYKLAADAPWIVLSRTVDATTIIPDIAPGIYDFRVKAINNLGVSSVYSTATRQISGLLAPPTEPQNLTISTIGGLAILRWDQSPDLDVRIGGKYVFRHSPDETASWAQTTTIGESLPGGSTTAVLPLKPGVYQAKAVDSSGIESVAYARVVTEQATALAFANVTSLTEDPAFSGVKTDCVVDGSDKLRLSGGGDVSGITLMSDAPSIANYGGISATGSYDFSGVIDLGAVKSVRLTSHVMAAIINQLDTIRSRTAFISSWPSIAASDDAAGDARVYVRKTNDDPAGTPTWADWQRLDSGEYSGRAFEGRLDLETYDPAYNVVVSELSITVDEVT